MKKLSPLLTFLLFVFLSIGLSYVFEYKIIYPSWSFLGIVFIVFGIVINIITINLFNKFDTTSKHHETPNSFIVHGPFKFTRNPIYLGMFFVLLGVFFLTRTLFSLIMSLFFIYVMNELFIKKEEEIMKKYFGDKFNYYKSKVRRWF